MNLYIRDKEFITFLGPSGCGKTTTLRMIAGFDKPTDGKILLNGKDITNLSICERAKLGLNYAFQQPVLFAGITVKDLIRISPKRISS